MENQKTGLSVDGIKIVANDIEIYRDKIVTDLNKIYEILNRIRYYYQDDNQSLLYQKIDNLQLSVKVIQSNIESYYGDCLKLIASYGNQDIETAESVRDDILG